MFWGKNTEMVNTLLCFMHLTVSCIMQNPLYPELPCSGCRNRSGEVPSSTVRAPTAAWWGQSLQVKVHGARHFSVCFSVSSSDCLLMLQPALTTDIAETARLGCFSCLFPAMAHAKSLGKSANRLAVAGEDSLPLVGTSSLVLFGNCSIAEGLKFFPNPGGVTNISSKYFTKRHAKASYTALITI